MKDKQDSNKNQLDRSTTLGRSLSTKNMAESGNYARSDKKTQKESRQIGSDNSQKEKQRYMRNSSMKLINSTEDSMNFNVLM